VQGPWEVTPVTITLTGAQWTALLATLNSQLLTPHGVLVLKHANRQLRRKVAASLTRYSRKGPADDDQL